MKIEKSECSYQVTECDLKFGEQITLDGELLIPASALDKIRAEIDRMIICNKESLSVKLSVLQIIDKYRNEVRE